MEDTLNTLADNNSKKNKKLIVIALVILLLLLLLTVGILTAIRLGAFENLLSPNNSIQEPEEKKEEDITEETKPQIKEYVFKGKTVTATLPEGWVIEEYYNGEGTQTLLSDKEYKGITGLKIKNGEREIFSFRAVSGIGGVGCPVFAKFSDYNPSQLEEITQFYKMNNEQVNISDYTNTEYTEFTTLGKKFRNVGVSYYHDTVSSNDFFEAECLNGLISSMDGFSFTDSDGYTETSYFYGPVNDFTLLELETVNKILKSIKLV
jgi:hypothetical protein